MKADLPFYAALSLFLLGILLGAFVDNAWLWLAVLAQGGGLLIWAVIRIVDRFVKAVGL